MIERQLHEFRDRDRSVVADAGEQEGFQGHWVNCTGAGRSALGIRVRRSGWALGVRVERSALEFGRKNKIAGNRPTAASDCHFARACERLTPNAQRPTPNAQRRTPYL